MPPLGTSAPTDTPRGRHPLRIDARKEAAAIRAVPSAKAGDPTDRNSPIEKKIALFRRLFRGRSDVFPIRWENRTTGRSG
jgi:hypothetical protein